LAWTLKWGDHVKAFELQTKKTGIPAGPMKNRPRLHREDVPYYNAFQTCNASRPLGPGGAGAIPISEVLAFLQLVGIAIREERVKYLHLIQDLDNLALEHWAEEAKKKSP
jgi:hypothetical protein